MTMQNTYPFVGREPYLKQLQSLKKRKSASLVVIRGRRRVGKSRLVEEFAKGARFIQFAGLAPDEGVTAQDQRDEFCIQLSSQTNLPSVKAEDWSNAFSLLASQIQEGPCVVLLDEITWMAHGDDTFLSKLKNAWELHFKKNPELILVICGSVSSWIEKNVASSTGYFGRISLDIILPEMNIAESNALLDALGFKRSVMEKLTFLSLTGGIPWYIEQLDASLSAETNIQQMCFIQNAMMLKEYKRIFHDLFGNKSERYALITQALTTHTMMDYNDLSKALGYAKGSALTEYLNDLILCGYVTKHKSWSLKTGNHTPRIVQYRLSDNYLRFYYRFMQNKINAIESGNLEDVSVENLPGWSTVQGLQFENLVLNNRKFIFKALGIKPERIVADGPYLQRTTQRQKGCQIDFMVQVRSNTLYVCEIKFSHKPIGMNAVNAMKEKIERLALPKGFAAVPVLIQVNGVTDEVLNSGYFTQIIDFGDFL